SLIEIYTDLGDHDTADQWVEHARTSFERLGDAPSLELTLLSTIGILRQEQGRYPEPLQVQLRALELLPDEGDEIRRAKAHNNLGATYDYAGEHARAIEHFERALALYEARRGPDHPDNVYPLANLAWARMEVGELDRAEPLLHRAIDLQRRANTSDTYALATLLSHLGSLHAQRGQHPQALATYEEALTVAEAEFGPEHPMVGNVVMNMAGERMGLGQPAQAQQTYERALGILERALGPQHDDVALARSNLADLLVTRGQPAEALEQARQAIAIYEALGLGSDRSSLVLPLTVTGAALVALERAPEALAPLERAVRIAARDDVSPRERADTMLALADALWATGHDHLRAHQLALDARLALASHPEASEATARIEAWLSAHPMPDDPAPDDPPPTPAR
ncbi:MAG: tetratricopeptide repeat protein, partial [Myxococcales bacterium]|nr:tetratricopeptide repeat protein [Myxococcales bacterium]